MPGTFGLSFEAYYENTDKNIDRISLKRLSKTFSTTGYKYISNVMALSTSPETVPMGEVTDPQWGWVINFDESNSIFLKTSSGGVDFCKIPPNSAFPIALDPTKNAIQAYASAGTPDFGYFFVQT